MSVTDDLAALRQEVESLKRAVQQRPLWSTPTTRKPTSLAVRISQDAHGFTVGQAVVQRYDSGTGTGRFVLAWAFVGLTRPTGGLYEEYVDTCELGVTGIVTAVFGLNHFELTYAGATTSYITEIPPGGVWPIEVTDLSLYLTENVDNAGQLSYYRTSSGIQVGTVTGVGEGLTLAPFRDSGTSFAVVARAFDGIKVLLDTAGVITVPDATANPDTKLLRLALCKYDATHTVVVVRGKCWIDAGVLLSTPGVRYLGAAGALNTVAATPEIVLGMRCADGGFSFEPGLGAAGLGQITGPAVVGRATSGLGAAVAIAAPADNLVLARTGGALAWTAILTAMVTDKQITPAKLADALAYTIVGNGTNATATPSGFSASADGQVPNRKASALAFTEALELGTTGAGLGSFKCWFGVGKYLSLDTSGNVDLYNSATARVQIDATGKVTITYPNSNTVTIDTADFVGSSKAVKLREVDICDAAGSTKKILVLCSQTY